MDKPVVSDVKPCAVELKQGVDYYFCTCGKSGSQPFCDGSHKGSGFQPMPFTADADRQACLCLCKQTGNAPFCDGTHKQVPADLIGKAFRL